MPWHISALAAHHDRQAFDCGEPALNAFLQKLARQQAGRDFSRSYVAIDGDAPRIGGFYAISAGAIAFEHGPAHLKLPRYPIPVARIGRLAVDLRDQGTGVGAALLRHALRHAVGLADKIGLHAVVVDAKEAQAAAFYARYGFKRLQDGGLTLFMPMALVRLAVPPVN